MAGRPWNWRYIVEGFLLFYFHVRKQDGWWILCFRLRGRTAFLYRPSGGPYHLVKGVALSVAVDDVNLGNSLWYDSTSIMKDDSYHPSKDDFLPHAQFGKGKSGNMNPCTESSENPQWEKKTNCAKRPGEPKIRSPQHDPASSSSLASTWLEGSKVD